MGSIRVQVGTEVAPIARSMPACGYSRGTTGKTPHPQDCTSVAFELVSFTHRSRRFTPRGPISVQEGEALVLYSSIEMYTRRGTAGAIKGNLRHICK